MERRTLGPFGPVSVLSLGGGGISQHWGATTREESVATVKAAVDAGIDLLDVAPRYGDGEAEDVIGATFGGRLPAGVRITSKGLLGDLPPSEVELRLRASVHESLQRMRLQRLDLFFLHSNVVPQAHAMRRHPDAASRMTPVDLFRDTVRPAMAQLVQDGLVGAWGLTGIGHPETIRALLAETPRPAAVQIVTNVLDSPGGLKLFDGPSMARELLAAAAANDVGIMGIRAVQAGALTDRIDRPLPDDNAEMRDYRRAGGFRRIAAALGESAAALAHRYALAMPGVATVVLGVKNRRELAECVDAAARPLDAATVARIDAAVTAG